MKLKPILIAASVALLASQAFTVSADVNLDAQRKEKQTWKSVPGKKITAPGFRISPLPQEMAIGKKPVLELSKSKGINYIPGKNGDLTAEIITAGIPLSSNGTDLFINSSANARKGGLSEKEGSYILDINGDGVNITAADATGVFHALQSLRQIMESPAANAGIVPNIYVNDFPSLPYRGVVEGFYGNPWPHDVRLSLIKFMGRNKMNNYIYGPKDDPYHSSPNWRLPYPEKEADQIRELSEECNRNKVSFIWAVHPGQDIQWNDEDYQNLLNKFESMYNLGVRGFAVFFDDIQGAGTDSEKQAELLNNLTRDFVEKKGDVTNIMVCPTDYNQGWANKTEDGQLAVYGRKLSPKVEVFWTGAVVCSDIEPNSLEFVDSRIKRPALIWWNFPVTDYARFSLMMGPVYGLDTTLTPEQLCGIETNPMEQGEASKIALYSVADYAWNTPAYNPLDSWERALAEIVPEDTEAFRTFAINACDPTKGYRRAESWETDTFSFNDYTPEQFTNLKNRFAEIAGVPARLQGISNRQLLSEINPWLTEFGKLGQDGLAVLDLISTYESGDDAAFWKGYVSGIPASSDSAAFLAHRSGTMKLKPFIENNRKEMLSAWLASKIPVDSVSVSSLDVKGCCLEKTANAFDSDANTSLCLNGQLDFKVFPGSSSVTVLAFPGELNAALLQIDKKGRTVKETLISDPYTSALIDENATRIRISGRGKFAEIIME